MRHSWFDEIAMTVARGDSRRSFLRGIGAVIAGLGYGAFRPSAAMAQGQQGCLAYCRQRAPLGGRAFGDCMQLCATGTTFGSCESDADCFHTGCSGQLCASEDIITTCEFRCEYGCYQQAQCGCVGNACGFLMTRQLRECLRACTNDHENNGWIECGENRCDPNTEFCCNESCSICAPIGGNCIQIVCT